VNNLFYNSPNIINEADGGPVSHSYNALFDSGSISEIGVQIGTGDPFVNYKAGNYALKAATNSGLTLSAPYDTDKIGAKRGAGGVWNRGALEFASGVDGTRPLPPRFIYIK
jgi:hypothetical protein